LDTTKDYLSSFSAAPVEDGLKIQVITGAVPAGGEPLRTDIARQETVKPAQPVDEAVAKTERKVPATEPAALAWVNRIDFSAEPEGKSTVIMEPPGR